MQCEQFEKMMTLLSQVARPRLFTCIACPQVIVADKSFHKTDPPVCLPYNIILLRQSSRMVLQTHRTLMLPRHGIAIYNVAQSGCKAVQSNILSASTSAESATLLPMQCMQCNVLSSTHCMCWPTQLNPSSSSLVRFTRPRDVSAQAAPIRPAAVLVKYWAWATGGKAAAVLVDN